MDKIQLRITCRKCKEPIRPGAKCLKCGTKASGLWNVMLRYALFLPVYYLLLSTYWSLYLGYLLIYSLRHRKGTTDDGDILP